LLSFRYVVTLPVCWFLIAAAPVVIATIGKRKRNP
jgi:hypothetical protein